MNYFKDIFLLATFNQRNDKHMVYRNSYAAIFYSRNESLILRMIVFWIKLIEVFFIRMEIDINWI